MISQKCPKCKSSRIRRGYRPTPIWSKLMFRYNLLCDGCNWEFTGFAIPGTVSNKPTRKPKKSKKTHQSEVEAGFDEDSGLEIRTQGKRENKEKTESVAKILP